MADQHLDVPIQLRFGDMDINNHINNVEFARIFEESRIRSFAAWLPDRPEGFSVLVARQDIVFTAVLEYSLDPVTVRSCVSRIGNTSFTLSLILIDPDGVTCAVAETTMVSVAPDTGRPTPVPDLVRDSLGAHVVEGSGIPARA
ncbi:thioesterase family protein [Gordonia sp. ABSL11-1]|uniref:acyl-CoA thioesterase n=1 Tax=Gordonia sp. ABSL11-1 TaxID=3053924 RepID=UPI002573C595|nr:thioesterase family protein [Gordonia sp. ABSL11-1]MDL9946827.1 thioesterase family protein [Gordonia sp. ABSL11-1]